MLAPGSRIRRSRLRAGLSQAALAHAAGVSLATLQNVEAGRANPALATLERVLQPLGLELAVVEAPPDWPTLIALGLPLSGPSRSGVARDSEALRLHVSRAASELSDASDTAEGESDSRRRDALHALVLAAHLHYPDVTRGWLPHAPDVAALIERSRTGRVVKLTRIAVRNLAEYL